MRNEYPRPDKVRKSFISLDEEWNFDFDDENVGHQQQWFSSHKFSKKINVPFCFESKLSGIGDTGYHDYVWYQKTFIKPKLNTDEVLFLNFEGVDYLCEVYINGEMKKSHYGSNGGFSVDITEYLKDGENSLVVFCFDPGKDINIPRGKQDWEESGHAIWYTRTTGIFKPVWMQVVNKKHIKNFFITPNVDTLSLSLDIETTIKVGKILIKVSDKEGAHQDFVLDVKKEKDMYQIFLDKAFVKGRLWNVFEPNLFDIEFSLLDENGRETDNVKSYFGLRKISTKDTYVYINDKKVYQKLVLNQSYFIEGILTAPSIKDLENDIKNMIAMGFNGCRIHQKTEDPYFLYLCDKYGFLIWQECASCYGYTSYNPRRLLNEWIDIVKNNYNHPCIIAYTPLNESWGVEGIPTNKAIQAHAMSLYYLIKSLDQSRLVISNDGWEQCKTDLLTIHNYSHGQENDIPKYNKYVKDLSTRKNILSKDGIGRYIINPGFVDEGQPVLLTEFGGVAFQKDARGKAWGYTTCQNEDDYVKELKRIYSAIAKSNCIRGICYTQLTDVEQEVNGLMTYDRKFKVDPKIIKAINDSLK